jgi:hypothetical protein
MIASHQSASLVILESIPGELPWIAAKRKPDRSTHLHRHPTTDLPTDESILEKGASIFLEHGADLICYRERIPGCHVVLASAPILFLSGVPFSSIIQKDQLPWLNKPSMMLQAP